MVAIATGLAGAGGPSAVVLREVARRAEVTPTAAYRHFADHRELLGAVSFQAMKALSAGMLDAQAAVPDGTDPAEAALSRWWAAGEAYVRLAAERPGLFRTWAECRPVPGEDDEAVQSPSVVLDDAGEAAVAAGAFSPDAGGDDAVWPALHGLAVLVSGGRIEGSSPRFEQRLARVLEVVARGLGADPALVAAVGGGSRAGR